jgi:hypothetical protein
MDYRLDDRSSIADRGKIFLFSTVYTQILGHNYPHIKWVLGVPSLGVKRPGREAGHILSSSVEVKNGGSIAPCFHGRMLN